MKIFIKLGLITLISVFAVSCSQYKYETVKNDPTNARIYTLDNGLKVYMSVTKDQPRIDAHIAVKVGGKNDPHETTGLAHYFEHLMFKGTESFGTQNYSLEKPLLDAIEAQFEIYRKTTDEAQRKAIYHVIDSISYEASKISIPNEYDKLMAAIGASGTNAYTGYDMTVYTENIPSNQVENWAKIQSDRFQNSVIRGFHTELETVYEEKNMSLTQDARKVYEAMFSALFKNHPYGTQTVLGTQQNLKNPSITNIKNYYKEWYVPNNMAICMSGDFDPDATIKIIDKYFGGMKPNPNLKKMSFEPEAPIAEPIVKEVYGLEAPNITLAWRFPGSNDPDMNKLMLISQIMSNGQAGLIDLNINQKQKVLSCYGGNYSQADYSVFLIQARPKQGQTLEEVKEIVLKEIENLKAGNFNDDLLQAIVNNYKLRLVQYLEGSEGRTDAFVNSFINDVPWEREVNTIENISKITKEEIMAYANANFKNNYAQINKIEKKDPNEVKIAKPEITPIFTNRDTSSTFLREIQNTKVAPIEPVFVDFKKDMSILNGISNTPILYKQNTTNDFFYISYLFEMGNNEDKALGTAISYLDYLGTDKMTPEEVKQAFYKLACSFSVYPGSEQTSVSISGLGENMKEAITLLETLLSDAQAHPEALKNLKADILKSRQNSKLNQRSNFYMLESYGQYGPKSPATNILSAEELNNINDSELLERIHKLTSFEHDILYYGPMGDQEFVQTINTLHKVPQTLTPIVKNESFKKKEVKENSVIIAPYDAKQIYLAGYSNKGEKFDPSLEPIIAMYNEYFGGGMNAIVFQEMREARGLAYSAWAGLEPPYKKEKSYEYTTFIATQNDKTLDALAAFDEIINEMPESEAAFNIAKESLLTNLRTSRTIKWDILNRYLNMKDLGLDYDIDKDIFEKAQTITLKDVTAFQQEWVKNRKYTIMILGDAKDLDLKGLEKYGKVTQVKTSDIFGY
jgi:predicted Zn-dependent peptidase